MILFTVDANFIDEMKIGRQFPGLMKFYNKICFINIGLVPNVVFESMDL